MTQLIKKGLCLTLTLLLALGMMVPALAEDEAPNGTDTEITSINVNGLDYLLFTSFTATNGSGGTGIFTHEKMFDGDFTTAGSWHDLSSPAYVEFTADESIIPKGYIFNSDDPNSFKPSSWVLKAKADAGDEWSVISAFSEQSLPSGQEFSFPCDNVENTEYQYFRFEVSNNANNIWLTEIRLYGISEDVKHLAFATIGGVEENYAARNYLQPTPVVVLGRTTLTAGTDYTVSTVGESVSEGTQYTMTVTGTGDYQGSASVAYKVVSNIAFADIRGISARYLPQESSVHPVPTVMIGSTTLTEGTDYTIIYDPNDNGAAGNYTLTISGVSPYTGTKTVDYTVADADIYINNASDWEAFAAAVGSGNTFEGLTVKLTADISTHKKIGTVSGNTPQNPFSGIFDGGGHTITASGSTTFVDQRNQGTAPFCYIDGATIKNLNVAGKIIGITYAAGLVGFAKGTGNRIENCNVSAEIVASSSTRIGGILGHGTDSDITIENCVFSGKLSGGSEAKGAILGWSDEDGAKSITDCIYFIPNGQSLSNLDLVKGTGAVSVTRSYMVTGTPIEGEISMPTVVNDNTYYVPCRVSGVNHFYKYTGDEITVVPTVTAIDGTVLAEGAQYSFSISPAVVQDAGSYTMTITGVSPIEGAKTLNFTVSDGLDVTSRTTWMSNAIYKVTGDVTVTERIGISGVVELILGEGATLNAKEGIELSDGNTLIISGNGALVIDDCRIERAGIGAVNAGTLIINGGNINVTGGIWGAGFGGSSDNVSGGSVTINGGVVNVTGGKHGAGIGGGSTTDSSGEHGVCGVVTINGGQVTAVGGEKCEGIGPGYYAGSHYGNEAPASGIVTLNWTEATDFIQSTYGSLTGLTIQKPFTVSDVDAIIVNNVPANFNGMRIVPKSVSVTFDMQGKGENVTVSALYGSDMSELIDATFPDGCEAEGYQFLYFSSAPFAQLAAGENAWTDNMNLMDDVFATSFDTVLAADITVYAVWLEEINEVTLTVTPAECGDRLQFTPVPVTFSDDSHVSLNTSVGSYWYDPDDFQSETTVGGKVYNAFLPLIADYGYAFPEEIVYTVNGGLLADTMDGGSFDRRIEVSSEAVHNYQFDSFVWSKSGNSAQAKLVCANDAEHVTYENAEMSQVKYDATCENDAYIVYTAAYDGHSEDNTVTIPDTAGHVYGDPVWSWTDGFNAAITFTCKNGDDTQRPEVTVTSTVTAQPTATQPGERTYTATAEFGGKTYTDVKTEVLPATGEPDTPSGDNLCKWCGQPHTGFFGKLVGFFHSILYFFAHLFGKR